MSKKKKNEIGAVIDIGSNSLNMKVGQLVNGSVHVLENLRYPLALGRDTFNYGKISTEKLAEAYDVLSNFKRVADEYQVGKLHTVTTSALREAENREFVLDQIQIHTGLGVQVLDDATEKTFIYKEMCRKLNASGLFQDLALLVYMGAGSMGVALYDKGSIRTIQNLKTGALRLSELFQEMQQNSVDFYKLEEEYLKGITNGLINILPEKDAIKHFVISGLDLQTIVQSVGDCEDNEFQFFKRDVFEKFYNKMKKMTIPQMMEELQLPEEKAEILYSSMCIYKTLLAYTKASKIAAPAVYLADALLHKLVCPREEKRLDLIFSTNAILSLLEIAKRYNCDMAHVTQVERIAKNIFDKLKSAHSLQKKHGLLLQAACILHEIGKFVNNKDYEQISYEIIKKIDIIGLNETETYIVALIVLYHTENHMDVQAPNFAPLSFKEKIVAAKLCAILRLADALDMSYEKKFGEFQVKVQNDTLTIVVDAGQNVLLEEWAFYKNAVLFKESFGMDAVFKQKKVVG